MCFNVPMFLKETQQNLCNPKQPKAQIIKSKKWAQLIGAIKSAAKIFLFNLSFGSV